MVYILKWKRIHNKQGWTSKIGNNLASLANLKVSYYFTVGTSWNYKISIRYKKVKLDYNFFMNACRHKETWGEVNRILPWDIWKKVRRRIRKTR
jgi:hypothetical protein